MGENKEGTTGEYIVECVAAFVVGFLDGWLNG